MKIMSHVSGLDPERRTYRSLALFSDPDGNSWLLQEITTRLPGRIDGAATSFGSASDLSNAFRRAEATASTEVHRAARRELARLVSCVHDGRAGWDRVADMIITTDDICWTKGEPK